MSFKNPRWVALGLVLGAASNSGCSLKARPLPLPPRAEAAPAEAETTADPSATDWSYLGNNGPDSWASIRDEWTACGQARQSPVDLPLSGPEQNGEGTSKTATTTASPLSTSKLEVKLGSLPLQAQSDGRLVTFDGSSTQILNIDGQPASLDRIELHQPAEHKLSGVAMAFEMVLWFVRPGTTPIALSLLYRSGAENKALDAVLQRLPKDRTYNKTALGTQLQLSELINQPNPQALSYSGSLTVPPCTEEIPRLVYMYVGELSNAQLEQLRKVVPNSQRPVQPLGARTVGTMALKDPGSANAAPSDTPPANPKKTSAPSSSAK